VCWLTCCVRKDRRLNTELRLALVSELAHVAGPTVTYGPYCRSGNLPLAKTEFAEVLHTQPATAALTRSQQLHMLSCPS